MIMPNARVYMADKTTKFAKDVVVGDELLAVDLTTETYYSTKCTDVQKVISQIVFCNDMQIGVKSMVGTYDDSLAHFSNMYLHKNLLYFNKPELKLQRSFVYKFDAHEFEELINLVTDRKCYIAGPATFGPFFIFLGVPQK